MRGGGRHGHPHGAPRAYAHTGLRAMGSKPTPPLRGGNCQQLLWRPRDPDLVVMPA